MVSRIPSMRTRSAVLPSSIPNPDRKIGTNVILDGDNISVVNSYPMGEVSYNNQLTSLTYKTLWEDRGSQYRLPGHLTQQGPQCQV